MQIITGTIGSKSAEAIFDKNTFTLKTKKNVLMSSLSIICFQRTGLGLKTIDAVYISDEIVHVHTIDSTDYDRLQGFSDHFLVYDLGSQCGSWKKWLKTAKTENWSIEDWKPFLDELCTEIEIESEEESNDSDWQPSGEESESEYDSMSDSE